MQPDFESSGCRTADKTPEEDFEAIMKYTESLLSDLDMNPDFELESTRALIAALDARDEKAIAISAKGAVSALPFAFIDWLTSFRELVRDHGPFSPEQAVQIVHGLNSPARPTKAAAPCLPRLPKVSNR